MSNRKATSPLPPRLAQLHRELGISGSYASERGLAPHAEAQESNLVEIGINPDGRSVRLLAAAAEAWRAMKGSAEQAGFPLLPLSGFRSVARQTEIIQEKINEGQSLADILRYVAAPGFSEHHTGRALDIGISGHIELTEGFAETAAFGWLEKHAGQFHFSLSYPRENSYGIGYEPWHWCWRE